MDKEQAGSNVFDVVTCTESNGRSNGLTVQRREMSHVSIFVDAYWRDKLFLIFVFFTPVPVGDQATSLNTAGKQVLV